MKLSKRLSDILFWICMGVVGTGLLLVVAFYSVVNWVRFIT
jgi:hypothetical protein